MAYSSPSIVVEAGRRPDGSTAVFDDYREAYYWLRQNSPPDSKILSWWDYGYQMSSMANRSVIVDNNTWNNTHIATVGRALATSEEAAYPILQSLDVDYVLVIFGGMVGYSSDDINKFLWPVRIGSGVYPDDMPKERDFYSSSGQYDVSPSGSSILHESLAYKLCYYRFSELGIPDRVRNSEVVKDIHLEHLEEAFTSEHWIVRIFKVKKLPNVEAAVKKTKKQAVDEVVDLPTKFLGCTTKESALSADKVYTGGHAAGNYRMAVHHAHRNGKKYFAMARVGGEGHVFAFDSLEGELDGNDGGCDRPCLDDNTKSCGCADAGCEEAGSRPGKGEEHNRRWAVYAFE
jgi:dolichyl-diphosphooligosaccharide--protein glycosyltransferase